MKRVLSSILISFIIFANLLAPFSVGSDKNKIEISTNEARAEDGGIKMTATAGSTGEKIEIEGTVIWTSVEMLNWTIEDVRVILKDPEGKEEDRIEYADLEKIQNIKDNADGKTENWNVVFGGLTSNKQYIATVEARQIAALVLNASWTQPITYNANVYLPARLGMWNIEGESFDQYVKQNNLFNLIITINDSSVKTQGENVTTLVKGEEKTSQNSQFTSSTMPACTENPGTWFTGCIARALYYILFIPTSYLFALSGVFFDSTFAYSVQDSSYRSTFVVEGWGLVRDICNMFFIFVLLYVAIATTLGLNSVKTKETIINVVIIGLFINFSLFAAQLIIDASNITARVFYNADTIVIDMEDGANLVTNTTPGGAKPTENGVISLSAGLVNKINPQNIIINSKKINEVGVKGGNNLKDTAETAGIGTGAFIIIVLLASAVNIVGFIVFLTIGMMFIARVVGLWIAMIIAPLAFFTYILPEQMAGIKMIGWKNWWPDTLKMAFLAPVFIFFMYLILKFLELDLIADAKNQTGLTFFIGTLMPFAFIMFFLMKAKKIATDMAGEMGEMATKAGSAIGGFALGAATGGTAMLMRGSLGRLGSSIANSDTLKAREAAGGFRGFLAKNLRNVGTGASVASFDARNTKAGAAAGKGLGADLGKAKEGGFVKARADNVAARVKRANELELSEDSAQTQAVRHAEHELHAVKTDPDRQNTTLDLNNGINNDPARVQAGIDAANAALPLAEAALIAAEANLTAAEAALAADPANQGLIDARYEALNNRNIAMGGRNDARSAVTSAMVGDMGLGGLDRAVTQAEGHVIRAERAVKDAETAYLAAATQANRDALDNAIQDRDAEINGGARHSGRVNADGTITTNVATGRDQARANKLAREATIRAHERDVHIAEDALARAQNEVIRNNNHIRHEYAQSIQGAWSNAINGVLTLGEHSALGEREASYKVLAGAHEEKKVAEHH